MCGGGFFGQGLGPGETQGERVSGTYAGGGGAQGCPRNHQRAAGGGHVLKRPENSAPFPASHLPHPFPSKPRERRRTRSYKKPSQERSEEEGGGGRKDGAGGSAGPACPSCGGVGGTEGGAPSRPRFGVFIAPLVPRATSRDAPVV